MEESKTPPQNNLPPALCLTPERLAQIAEEQAKRKAEFEGRTRRSPEEEALRFAHSKLQASIENYRTARAHRMLERMKEFRDAVAEGYAETGNYVEAVRWSKSNRVEYQNVLDAILRNDSEVCDCPDTTIKEKQGTVHLSPRFVAGFVRRDGQKIPIVQCGKCGHLNVRQPSERVRQLMENQQGAVN